MERPIDTITKRIDAVTKIPAAYLSVTPPPPKSVKIELTNRCNYNCQYCGLRGRETPGKEDIDLAKFRDWTSDMYRCGTREFGLFYIGESCMAPALLVDATKHVKSLGPDVYSFLTTNGSLLNPMLAGELMAAGLDSLKFSINATRDQFREAMGVKPALLDKALANLKAAHEIRHANGYKTRLYASSIKFDGEQQAKMEAMLAEHVKPYVDEHYWLPLFSEMQSPLAEKNKARGWKPNAGNQGRLDALRDPLPCWACFTESHVRVDGSVSACCFGADATFDMGNLNEQGFMAAWHSKPFRELRAKHLSGDVHGTVCERCIHG